MTIPMEYSTPKPLPPRPVSNATREVFTAYARGNTRRELMDAMRTQAEGYFECRVSLRDAAIQPAPEFGQHMYQATSRWVARPGANPGANQ